MRSLPAFVVLCALLFGVCAEHAAACGDKFLLVGRGVRFERAYAAIHPASILIVLPLKSVTSAAVRDSRLATALKMAGHRVEILRQAAHIPDTLARSHYDIVLAELVDAGPIRELSGAGGQKPSVVAVLEDQSPAAIAAAQQDFPFVLPAPKSIADILNLLDDVMKARAESARRTAAPLS